MLRLRCWARVRVIGGIARCDLPRKHKGAHKVWLGIDPIEWTD